MKELNKVIVFDLDETLGYFQEFGILWNSLQIKYSNQISFDNDLFNSLLDLYPELLRPNILNILDMIAQNQKNKNIKPLLLMIYTNNNGGKKWVNLITKYFESKVCDLKFDKIINAFKIDDKIIEPLRTGYEKKYSDFLRTTKLSKDTKICFIDDTFHPQMEDENIVYLHIKPYTYNLSVNIFLNRLKKHKIFGKKGFIDDNTLELIKFNLDYRNISNNNAIKFEKKDQLEQKVDTIVSKQILCFLQEFITEFGNVN